MAKTTRSLTGMVVAIAGGAGGIGRATAAALAAEGARVALGDLDGDRAAELAGAIGAGAVGLSLDVTSRRSYEMFLDEVERTLGPLDVLVNCAGIMPLAPLVDESDASTRYTLEVNVQGAILGAKLAVARFLSHGRGDLVTIAGVAGLPGAGGLGGGVTYAATQQALFGAGEALRSELRNTGVQVHMVVPSLVDTELLSGLRRPRWIRPVAPEAVGSAVVRSLQLELDEVRVRGRLGGLLRFVSRLPRRVRPLFARGLGTAGLLADPDPVRRAAYEARVKPPSARDRSASVASAAASVASAVRSHDGEPRRPTDG